MNRTRFALYRHKAMHFVVYSQRNIESYGQGFVKTCHFHSYSYFSLPLSSAAH
jgi:hypothetical protein